MGRADQTGENKRFQTLGFPPLAQRVASQIFSFSLKATSTSTKCDCDGMMAIVLSWRWRECWVRKKGMNDRFQRRHQVGRPQCRWEDMCVSVAGDDWMMQMHTSNQDWLSRRVAFLQHATCVCGDVGSKRENTCWY